MTKVLHDDFLVQGRASRALLGVEANRLSKCKDDFDTPNHHYSFCPTDMRGQPISTAGRLLPTDDEQPGGFHCRVEGHGQVMLVS